MLRKSALVIAMLATFTLPALAATHYYVAQNSTSKACKIVTKKPHKPWMEVGKAYGSMKDATVGLKADVNCKA